VLLQWVDVLVFVDDEVLVLVLDCFGYLWVVL